MLNQVEYKVFKARNVGEFEDYLLPPFPRRIFVPSFCTFVCWKIRTQVITYRESPGSILDTIFGELREGFSSSEFGMDTIPPPPLAVEAEVSPDMTETPSYSSISTASGEGLKIE